MLSHTRSLWAAANTRGIATRSTRSERKAKGARRGQRRSCSRALFSDNVSRIETALKQPINGVTWLPLPTPSFTASGANFVRFQEIVVASRNGVWCRVLNRQTPDPVAGSRTPVSIADLRPSRYLNYFHQIPVPLLQCSDSLTERIVTRWIFDFNGRYRRISVPKLRERMAQFFVLLTNFKLKFTLLPKTWNKEK